MPFFSSFSGANSFGKKVRRLLNKWLLDISTSPNFEVGGFYTSFTGVVSAHPWPNNKIVAARGLSDSYLIYDYTLNASGNAFSSAAYDTSQADYAPNGNFFFYNPSYDYSHIIEYDSTNDRFYSIKLNTAGDIQSGAAEVHGPLLPTDGDNPTGSHRADYSFDGTKLFIIESTSPPNILVYNLSTSFNISTATFSEKITFDSGTSVNNSFRFSPDGTKLYNNNSQYSFTSPYDIATWSKDGDFDFSDRFWGRYPSFFPNDGTTLIGSNSNSKLINLAKCTTSYDLTSGVTSTIAQSNRHVVLDVPTRYDAISHTGDMLFSTATTTSIASYTVSTPWDFTTISETASATLEHGFSGITHVRWGANGTKLYLFSESGFDLYQYTLTVPYDLSTASFDLAIDLVAEITNVIGTNTTDRIRTIIPRVDGSEIVWIMNDGFVESGGDRSGAFVLSTPWDLSSRTLSGSRGSWPGGTRVLLDAIFDPSGEKVFSIHNIDGETVFQGDVVNGIMSLTEAAGATSFPLPTTSNRLLAADPDSGTLWISAFGNMIGLKPLS